MSNPFHDPRGRRAAAAVLLALVLFASLARAITSVVSATSATHRGSRPVITPASPPGAPPTR